MAASLLPLGDDGGDMSVKAEELASDPFREVQLSLRSSHFGSSIGTFSLFHSSVNASLVLLSMLLIFPNAGPGDVGESPPAKESASESLE